MKNIIKQTNEYNISMNIKRILSSVFVIVGSFAGAGFVSGKEISAFFLGGNVVVSLIAFAVFFVFFTFFLLYDDGFYESGPNLCSSILILVADLFMMGGLLSAADELFARISHCRTVPFVSVVIIFFSFYIQRRGMGEIKKICKFFTPLIVILTVILILTSNKFNFCFTSDKIRIARVFSYAGLNVFVMTPIIKRLRGNLNKKEIVFTTLIAASFLIFLIALLCVFIGDDKEIVKDELPLFVKFSDNVFSKSLFAIAIFSGIITAVISEHYSVESVLTSLIKKNGRQTKNCLLAVPITVVFISKIGFNDIVAYAYPIIGFIGGVTILISAIFRLFFRLRQRRDTSTPQVYTK